MPTTTSYVLGRNCVASLPGVSNSDIMNVTINVSANELDVTTFKTTALTAYEFMAGLVDVSIDVTCTAVSGMVGDIGTAGVASLSSMDAVIVEIKESATPKGLVEYTVTYGLTPATGS